MIRADVCSQSFKYSMILLSVLYDQSRMKSILYLLLNSEVGSILIDSFFIDFLLEILEENVSLDFSNEYC